MSTLFERIKFGTFAVLIAFASAPLMVENAAATKSETGAYNSERNMKHTDKKQSSSTSNERASTRNHKSDNKKTNNNETATSTKSSGNAPRTNPATPKSAKQVTEARSVRTTDPAGNNGTIKIDALPFDSHPNNQPHVTCTFQVDFYGYDKGDYYADVNFDLHAPTTQDRTLSVVSGDVTPHVGGDAAGGGTDLDANEIYTLAFTGEPHSKQGYHVKVTVHAPYSKGNDTKTKVFWVQGCESEQSDEDTGTVIGDTDSPTPVQPHQGQGQLLSESASTTRELPTKLPATGSTSQYSVLFTLLATAMTYGAMYFMQNRRITDN